jgi:hypothetical protein
MNLKNNEFLMLVVAFLLGYFAHQIMKGCRLVEGAENSGVEDRVYILEEEYKISQKLWDEYIPIIDRHDEDFVKLKNCKFPPLPQCLK